MKFEIFKFDTVTSTNDIAINLIKKEGKELGCIYADSQTMGRGTQGKKWISEVGNLFVSIFFPIKKNYPSTNEFSLINPTIISEVVKKFCEQETISFKWPNDIFVNGKKICGILQEVITYNSKKFLIIGIGINIISNPKFVSNYETTSIFLETKKKPKIGDIINILIESYEKFFNELNNYNFANIRTKVELMSVK